MQGESTVSHIIDIQAQTNQQLQEHYDNDM